MATSVNCPVCHTAIAVSGRVARSRCPHCHAAVSLSSSSHIQAHAPAVGESAQDRDDGGPEERLGQVNPLALRRLQSAPVAQVLVVMLGLLALMECGWAAVVGLMVHFPPAIPELIVTIVAAVGIIAAATALVFLVWLYRASKDLRTLQVAGQKYSPRWAVAWFLVPIANLLMPCAVMQEIWQASDPRGLLDALDEQRDTPSSPLVLGWWVLQVAGLILALVNARLFERDWPVSVPREFEMIPALTLAVASLALIVVVGAITRRQRDRFNRLYRHASWEGD